MRNGPAACVSLLGSATPLAVIACSRSRPTWHVREEAGRHDGKALFLSEGQVDQYDTKVTMKDDDLGDNLRDERSARHLSDSDSLCPPTVSHDRVLSPFSLAQETQLRVTLPSFHGSGAVSSPRDFLS